MRATPGKQDDRFEQACLARRVGAPHELWAVVEQRVERRVAAQVVDGQGPEDRGVRPLVSGRGRRFRQDVVRTGITTCT